MKISLDLHGVVNDLPDVFKFITESVIKNGGEIHILTGSTTEKAKEELAELGYEENVNFTHVVGLPNLLENSGHISIGIHPIFGNKEYSKEDWNKAKGIYCKRKGINLHLDDTIEYEQYFKTPFARLWTKNK